MFLGLANFMAKQPQIHLAGRIPVAQGVTAFSGFNKNFGSALISYITVNPVKRRMPL